MRAQADIMVHSPNGEIVLVVEVKAIKAMTDEAAAQTRWNLLLHRAVPDSPFFLLVFPENLYLWCGSRGDGPRQADYKVATGDVLRPYLFELDLVSLSGFSLELLVSAWLGDLTASRLTRETVPPELAWIFDSGLYDGIHYGAIELEAAA